MAGVALATVLAQGFVAFARSTTGQAARCRRSTCRANLPRVGGDDGVRLGDIPGKARVSRRVTRPTVRASETWGLVTIDRNGGRGKATLRLTDSGRTARSAGERGLRRTDDACRKRCGQHTTALRDGLEALVSRLDQFMETSWGLEAGRA
jgi:hypothetical protein